jgi:S-adenosylmethionine/arginine decarboxylase-like enzyme
MNSIGGDVHLIFEGPGQQKLTMKRVGEYLLESIVESGMTLVEGPEVYRIGRGLQGYCILAESHTSIHITKGGYIFGDLFSCTGFDEQKVLECARGMLSMKIHKHGILNRGLEFLDGLSPDS